MFWPIQKSKIPTPLTLAGSAHCLSWFQSNLKHIYQFTSINGVNLFADDINFLYDSNPLKDINKKNNFDMSWITKEQRANRISLNVAKTEIMTFQLEETAITKTLKNELFK